MAVSQQSSGSVKASSGCRGLKFNSSFQGRSAGRSCGVRGAPVHGEQPYVGGQPGLRCASEGVEGLFDNGEHPKLGRGLTPSYMFALDSFDGPRSLVNPRSRVEH